MKIKTSFLLSNMNIFQATCAFIAGCFLSSEVLHLFSCHVRKHRSVEAGFTALNEHRRELNEHRRELNARPTEHSEPYWSKYELKSADDVPDEEDQFFQRHFRIGCLVLYDEKAPAKVLYTSWIPQCDINMTLDTRQTFPNPAENTSSYFLKEISKLGEQSLDYYLFATHDAYVVMDNLREYLSHCDPNQPMAYGHALLKDLYEGGIPVYTVGGTLVLSREALLRASQAAECMTEKWPTTATILACLHKSGGNLVDSRDQFAGNTFLAPAKPFQILTASLDPKFVKEQKFSTNYCESVNCLSDFPVAFHQMTSGDIHLTHFLIDWANYSRYTGANKYSKLRLKFNGSKLPLGPPLNASKSDD